MRLRTFNRIAYKYYGWDRRKEGANHEANILRSEGYRVRVEKARLKRRGYNIWVSLGKVK